jgi:hypothetical protein
MRTFKNIYVIGAVFLTALASCDSDKLTDLNKNPNVIDYTIPEYSFTQLVLNSNPGENYRPLGQGLQYFSTYKEVPATGDKFFNFGGMNGNFNVYNGTDGTGNNQNVYAPGAGQWNRANTIKAQIPGAENVNRRAACDILRLIVFQQRTDAMGDLPYSEAMKGLENLKPKYDTQKSIYTAMLTELDAALTSMDASKLNVFGNADPFFKGDVAKWKKFGYTLMLRMGMRLSEVDANTAKTWVAKALAGGVMTANADIAYIKYANVTNQMNPRVTTMINGDFTAPGGDNVEGSKYSKRFIDHLKNTQDPRLPVISVVWQPSGNTYTPNNTPSVQKGMLNGSINSKPTDFDTYSEPSLLYIDRGSPIIVMGPAEAYLLTAEAVIRGWYSGTTAKAAYENAVRAAMAQWALWPSAGIHSGTITTAQVDAYLAANPFLDNGTFDQKLEQIMTQKWVSLFGDDYEVWAEWRRTKYPVFNYANWTLPSGQVVPYPGNVTGGKMFRRMALPTTERNTNADNYFDAINRQGFKESTDDNLQGRVWWDVGPKTGQTP